MIMYMYHVKTYNDNLRGAASDRKVGIVATPGF